MNAQNLSKVRIGLTATAMALCGALAISALAISASCAGGSGGTGGTAGGGSGGGSGGSGAGGSGGAGTCVDPASDAVNFCNGKAQGVMTGYAYIALGSADTATDPKCAPDSANPARTSDR